MSLRARIILVITMAAVVLVMIGLTSILNMRRMANADAMLYREGALPIPVLSHIAVSFQRMRIASRDLLAASGTVRKNQLVHDIETLSREIDTLAEVYAGWDLSGQEKMAFDQFKETRKRYLEYVVEIVSQATADRDQKGWDILNSVPYNSVVSAQLAALARLEDLQVEETKRITENNGRLARISIAQVAAAMFLAILFAGAGGLWLDRMARLNMGAQQALERSEYRFQLVARATSDGIWDWNLVTGEVWWNENVQTTFGYAPGEIAAGVEGWMSHIHPEDRDRVHRDISTALEGSELSWNDEYRFQRRDGSYADVLDRGHIIRNPAGKAIRMAGAMMDISGRKRTELELQQAKETAEVASRAKSEFLANMSHEIRTPMNGVIGMTQLALDTELTPEQREYLNTVKFSADSLLTVINDVLDFSKIEARKLDIEQIPFNLRISIDATMKALGVRADEKHLELAYQIAPDVPATVTGDPGRLRQILLNLVGNAIKFTEHGEVSMQVEKLSESDGKMILEFRVRDTGIGIPQEKQTEIFSAFSQADSSFTRRFGGTGLGLAISTQLVKLMGGEIGLESEPGQGSTFRFTVRLGMGSAAPQQPRRVGTSSLQDMRVLAVDDSATNRRILGQSLRVWGMRPVLESDGAAALVSLRQAAAEGNPFPLVIVDARMPNMDGFTLVEHIKKDPRLSASVIMMLTSNGQRGDATRCREIGVSAYLTKPVSESEFLEAILCALSMQSDKTEKPQLITRHSLREARRKSLRVLVVEDNPVNQLLAVRLVEKQGHSVVAVSSGRRAVETLESGHFDLVLMDVQMPEMDGIEATNVIRQKEQQRGAHIPIIAMTAHAMQGDRERCLQAGMDAYVAKPINTKDLFAAIENVIEGDSFKPVMTPTPEAETVA